MSLERPVNLYVAKGEVVVLEESFAVRITEIIDEKNK